MSQVIVQKGMWCEQDLANGDNNMTQKQAENKLTDNRNLSNICK